MHAHGQSPWALAMGQGPWPSAMGQAMARAWPRAPGPGAGTRALPVDGKPLQKKHFVEKIVVLVKMTVQAAPLSHLVLKGYGRKGCSKELCSVTLYSASPCSATLCSVHGYARVHTSICSVHFRQDGSILDKCPF